MMNKTNDEETVRRWRLVLGREYDGTGISLSEMDMKIDRSLEAVYGDNERRGGLGASAPKVSR